MSNSVRVPSVPQTNFTFHGKASSYFIICLVNALLVFITLGIYFPWALVKCRRYIYRNIDLNGACFDYQATGGAFLVSWLLTLLIIVAAIIGFMAISPAMAGIPVIAFFVLLPLMVIKSLRYQALMTSLNNVRFGFRCSAGKAYWTMLILPLLLLFASLIITSALDYAMGFPSDINSLLVQIAVMVLVSFAILGLVNGMLYYQWMKFLGNSVRFGIHQFNINVSLKRCMFVGILAMVILIPFIIVIAKVISPFVLDISMGMAMGGLDKEAERALVDKYLMQLIVTYLLHFTGLILVAVFVMSSLRNLFINGLKLGEKLTFRSTVTFTGLLMQIGVMIIAIACTCWLAYPWAKMRLVRYLAANTHVIGSLDDLELRDTDEPNDSGLLTMMSRGAMPVLPFI